MGEGTQKSPRDAHAQLAVPVGVIITLVWASSAAVGLMSGNFVGLEIVSPVMMIFVGYVFGINIVRTGEKAPTQPPRPARRAPSRRSPLP